MERPKEEAGKIELTQTLPHEMIVEILSRLPAKSLYRFRCVCKSWSALICPHFIRLNKTHHNLFLLFEKHYSLLDCYEASTESPIFKDYSLTPSLLTDARILNSGDGWLINKKMHELFLFNPFSGEYKVFPPYGAGFHYNQSYGICYDFSCNDYKVVCIVGWLGVSAEPSFTVFCFKTNSWTSIRFVPNWIHNIGTDWMRSLSFNGALHWNCWRTNEILRFDLTDEFKKLPGPPEEVFIHNFFLLAALRGNLCAWGPGLAWGSRLMMEMKQYGVKASWTPVYSINMLGVRWIRPLTFTKKGELVTLINNRELAIYNVEDNSSKTIMRSGEMINPKRVGTYAGSSINLNCDCWLNTKGRIS